MKRSLSDIHVLTIFNVLHYWEFTKNTALILDPISVNMVTYVPIGRACLI